MGSSSLSFLLLISMIPVLALAMSPTCSSSSSCSCGGQMGDQEIGQLGLGEDLLNDKLKKFNRPNLDSLSKVIRDQLRHTTSMGVKAELIRYDYPHSQTNSSQISMDIRRSLYRGRNLKTSKKMIDGAVDSVDRPLGMDADLTSIAPYEYLMKISIGSPAQHLLAVADTGSDLVWLQCTPPGEQPTNRRHFFQSSHSKTFSILGCNSKPCHLLAREYSDWITCSSRCEYSYYYADNSNTTGDLAMDTLHMKISSLSSIGEIRTASIHNFAFGCGRDQYSASMLYINSNGVVGLGKGALSFPSQLGAQFGRRFSYCLVDRSQASVKSSPILFGNIAVPTIPGVQYTPLLDNPVYPTYYYIGLERITVDAEALDIPSGAFEFSSDRAGEGGTMIDSGTTFTQLVGSAYAALVQALNSRIKYKRVAGYFDLCHDVTGIPINLIVVPSISFYFTGGAKFDLPLKNAFIIVPNDPVQGKTTMCLAMNNSTDLGFSIIGNYQQTNYHILYDLQEKRLGFVSQQCGWP